MIYLKSTFIQPELKRILQETKSEQEVSAAIGFVDHRSAERFANLCNQVVFDTTLHFEAGEEDITDKLRHYMLQNTIDKNIEAVGEKVTANMPKELIQQIDEFGDELGVNMIQSEGPGGRRGKAWMLDM